MRSHSRHFFESRVEWAKGLTAVITGQNTKIVRQFIKQLAQTTHGALTHVRMQVADLKDREPIESAWQAGRLDMIVPYLYAFRILTAVLIQPNQLQGIANNRVDRVPVLNVKEIDTTAKNASLMILFNSEPLTGIHSPETLLQSCQNVLLH